MNKIRICTVVIGYNLKEFLKNLEKIQNISSFIELRVDYIHNINLVMIEKIYKKVYKTALFTCRHKKQGGKYLGSVKYQNKIYQKVNDLGLDFIDIDLDIYNKIRIKNKKTKLIVSYHNFQGDGGYDNLISILNQMRKTDADIYKFALTTKTNEDVNNLYRLLLNKKKYEKMIVLGMGKIGRETRILTPLLGGYLTFASVGNSISAQGQIGYQDLLTIYKEIKRIYTK